MAIVPEFLIKRIYQKGSIKKTEEGITIVLKNVVGPGVISGFNFVQINDVRFEPNEVKFAYNGQVLEGQNVSKDNPIGFRLGQSGTLIMVGKNCLQEGLNKIVIEVENPEAGKVQLKVDDNFKA